MANQTPPTLEDQNFHFWSSVIRGYSFRDVNVEVPIAWSKSYVYVTVDGSDFNGYGLPFYAYLNRDRSEIGCYLTWRKGYEKGVGLELSDSRGYRGFQDTFDGRR